jgi:hypothetical protein
MAVTPIALAAVFSAVTSARSLPLDIDVSAARPLVADKLKAIVSAQSNQLGVTPRHAQRAKDLELRGPSRR